MPQVTMEPPLHPGILGPTSHCVARMLQVGKAASVNQSLIMIVSCIRKIDVVKQMASRLLMCVLHLNDARVASVRIRKQTLQDLSAKPNFDNEVVLNQYSESVNSLLNLQQVCQDLKQIAILAASSVVCVSQCMIEKIPRAIDKSAAVFPSLELTSRLKQYPLENLKSVPGSIGHVAISHENDLPVCLALAATVETREAADWPCSRASSRCLV